MFQDVSFWQMIMKGGATTMVLMAVSVLSWWIIIERAIKFARIKTDTEEFMDRVKKLLSKRDKEGAMTLCQTTPGPVAAVVREGIKTWDGDRERAENTMQRTLNYEAERMQSMLGILGSIGNVAPFIGLFGTVIGIIKAFHDLSLSSGGGPSVVANGIAEALVATAAGLFVAVPAVIAYNIFVRMVGSIETQAINAASELADILDGGK